MRQRRPAERGVLVVWGLLASFPFGGMTWQVLHHLSGFRRLGFDVWYVEDSDAYPYDPETWWRTPEYEANLAYLDHHMRSVGLGDRWIFRAPGTETYFGAGDAEHLSALYRGADAVFNLCASHEVKPRHQEIRRLVLLETDPVASQVAVALGDEAAIRTLGHYDYLFTYGASIGMPDCRLPVERYTWHPTRPPVCVDWWHDDRPPSSEALTTVANWKHDDRDVVYEGETWKWTKHEAFLRLLRLPERSALPLEIALGGASSDEEALMGRHGWHIRPSLVDPVEYRDYIRGSRGEFTPSKDLYVLSRSGWFSDRSVCYLASGRPVITEDTGFGNVLPTGAGLFAFSNEDGAVEAIAEVAGDYERHAGAAREIAHEFFAAERVLGDVLTTIGLL